MPVFMLVLVPMLMSKCESALREHEDTVVSNKMPFLFFDCVCVFVSEVFITFGFGRQRAVKGESTSPPL